jgi:hypothetical protein
MSATVFVRGNEIPVDMDEPDLGVMTSSRADSWVGERWVGGARGSEVDMSFW